MIERIRKVIPKELLVEEGFVKPYEGFPSRTVGEIYSMLTLKEKTVVSRQYKVMFLVKLGDTVEDVCLGREGSISMGIMVTQLLDGLLLGFEHLGALNPFRNPE